MTDNKQLIERLREEAALRGDSTGGNLLYEAADALEALEPKPMKSYDNFERAKETPLSEDTNWNLYRNIHKCEDPIHIWRIGRVGCQCGKYPLSPTDK